MNEYLSGNNNDPVIVSGNSLAAKLAWLQSNAQSDSNYIIEVNADESITPQELSYDGKNNITITLRGLDSKRIISLSSKGSLFKINNGVTLVLDNNITLYGRKKNENALVGVYKSGTLIMKHGSAIINNIISTDGLDEFGALAALINPGGVYAGGSFIMNGGTISGNSGGDAGGVQVGGSFIMNDGTISDNSSEKGGCVNVCGGTFTMNGGTISCNIAKFGGGGVYVYGGTFDMNGGTISGNTAKFAGGGVYVGHSPDRSLIGAFTKKGGTILGYASDTIKGNVVRDSSGTIKTGYGHSVAGNTGGRVTEFKDTTTGPTENLSYNAYDGSATGTWDEDNISSSYSDGPEIGTIIKWVAIGIGVIILLYACLTC